MGTPGAPLIGRSHELVRLRELAAGLSGPGALVLIEGDAGCGKTRLIEELAPHAWAGALEYAGAPFAPVRDLFLALAARAPRVLKHETALNEALRPVMELLPAQGRREVLDAVVAALKLYARDEPIVLAIEDLHWIDSASADVLVHIVRHLRSIAVLLVATYRSTETGRSAEARNVVAQLARGAAETISLRPLSPADSMLLVSQIHDEPMPLVLRRTICDLGQGNPLLLCELARHAAAEPAAMLASLPASLQALVHERLERFDETERAVLRVCAAMESFDHAVVAEIAGMSQDSVLDVLRKAREASIVSERGARFVFAHALIRRAVTDDVLAVELASLHARIAAHLQQAPSSPELHARLAYHFWMAGDCVQSERFNAQAAREALALYAFDDAGKFFERAINGREISAATIDLYEQLARAYEHAGRFKAESALRRSIVAYARAHEGAQAAAAACIALSRSYFQMLDDDGSLTAVRDGLSFAGRSADPARRFELHALLAWYLVHLRRLDEARESLDEADELLEHGSGTALVRYYEARAAYDVHACGGGEWKAHTERAIELAAPLDKLIALSRYSNGIALACASELDDYAYAFELMDRMQPLSDVGEQSIVPFLNTRARLLFMCGRLAEARAALEKMLPYMNDGPTHVFRAASVGIPLALRTGDKMLLAACARPRLLEEAFASNDPVVFGQVACGVAEHMIAQGRAGEAVALLERTLPRLKSAGNNFDLMLLAARIGSSGDVRKALDLLAPWTGRSRSASAVLALIKAYASQGSARVAYAQTAAELFASLPWPLHCAQALELAGERAQARGIYAECGAHADAARLAEGMRSAPAAPALSKREAEVALLVAEGKSNRAIAERLVLSERTVENHIASIFTKLGMRSRSEIASFVARENARAV